MLLGEKIRRLRNLCGLTQEELASRCELTKGYISQLENDVTEPSISTLEDVLQALGSNFKEFFNDDEEEKVVYKSNDYFVKEENDHKITWLVLNSQKNEMEPILLELNKGEKTMLDLPHEGQEFGYVIEGEIEVNLGVKKYVCLKGETFYFTTNKNHFIRNIGNKKAVVIWVSSPPNF